MLLSRQKKSLNPNIEKFHEELKQRVPVKDRSHEFQKTHVSADEFAVLMRAPPASPEVAGSLHRLLEKFSTGARQDRELSARAFSDKALHVTSNKHFEVKVPRKVGNLCFNSGRAQQFQIAQMLGLKPGVVISASVPSHGGTGGGGGGGGGGGLPNKGESSSDETQFKLELNLHGGTRPVESKSNCNHGVTNDQINPLHNTETAVHTGNRHHISVADQQAMRYQVKGGSIELTVDNGEKANKPIVVHIPCGDWTAVELAAIIQKSTADSTSWAVTGEKEKAAMTDEEHASFLRAYTGTLEGIAAVYTDRWGIADALGAVVSYQTKNNQALQHTDFLWGAYKPSCWWFECFELLRKFCLVGLPVLTRLATEESSHIEDAYGMLVVVLSLVVYAVGDPYSKPADKLLQIPVQVDLLLFLICGELGVVLSLLHQRFAATLLTFV